MSEPGRYTFVMLLFALGLAGCSGGGSDRSDSLPPPSAEVSTTLQQILETGLQQAEIHGVVVQARTPAWTWTSSAGNAGIYPPYAATPFMRFRIASVTKTFTATAICKLAEEGLLSLDDPLIKWVPGWIQDKLREKFEDPNLITLRLVLQHRSGIGNDDEESIIKEALVNPNVPVPVQVSITQGLDASPVGPPDGQYLYSDVGYHLLRFVIEAASKVTYQEFLQQKILTPLRLDNTFPATGRTIPGEHMRCLYDWYKYGWLADMTDLYMDWDRGAGDLISNSADLNRFHLALRSGQIISAPMLQQMFTFKGEGRYGFGYEAPGSGVYGHEGGYPGSHTSMYYLADIDTYLTVNVNSLTFEGPLNRDTLYVVNPLMDYLKSVVK